MRPVDSLVPLPLQGGTDNSLMKGVGSVARVVNMAPTVEGTLRTVQGPRDIIDRTLPPHTVVSPLTYNPVYSVGYVSLAGGKRHVLLIHTDNSIREFWGWDRRWVTIIGTTGANAQIAEVVPNPRPGQPGARFIPTSNGMIIVAPDGKAYFYDGDVVGYLGYSEAPSPPKACGPSDSSPDGKAAYDAGAANALPGTNDLNYASDGLLGWNHSLNRAFRGGRLGTTADPGAIPFAGGIEDQGAGVRGFLRAGSYRAYAQYIDRWGNVSPMSGPSDEIRFSQQLAKHRKTGAVTSVWAQVDLARKRVLWQGISRGPRGTVGRIIGRTKDALSSGDTRPYVLPGNAAPVRGSVATLDDNVVTTYPDNIPDAWLTTLMEDHDPVPLFTEGDVAFGRLWIAGIVDDPAAIMVSAPGRWGTFPKNGKRYPDPKGSPVVAVKAVPQGLLAFTRQGTHLYTANDAGDEFVARPVSTARGCPAPRSLATLPNGLTIWLGMDGFYGFDGESVVPLWAGTHEFTAAQHNRAAVPTAVACVDQTTGEYRCWVAVQGSRTPNRCYTTTDGQNWRWRTDISARGACSLADDNQVTVAAGKNPAGLEGVWVMDRGTVQVSSSIDTGWLPLGSDRERASSVTLHVRLRETKRVDPEPRKKTSPAVASTSRVRLDVYRDYRGEVVQTTHKPTFAPTAAGPASAFWDLTPTDDAKVRRARPYWVTFDVDVRSAESVRFRLSCDVEWEVMEVSFGGQRDMSGKRTF